MRIPRGIEWRAGAILVGVSAIFLGLLIVLTMARMDVGLEVEGAMSRTEEGWTLSAEVSGERLGLLSRCRHVRIRTEGGEIWYGRIIGLNGRLMQGRPDLLAEIEVRSLSVLDVNAYATHPVKAMLLEKRRTPVLTVLFDSILDRQKI